MRKTILNLKLGQPVEVDTDTLNDRTALEYLPMPGDPVKDACLEAVYQIYRHNGRTPYQAIVGTLTSILTGKFEDIWPEEPPTQPLPPTNFGILSQN